MEKVNTFLYVTEQFLRSKQVELPQSVLKGVTAQWVGRFRRMGRKR
jgi:hypothetical protein